MPMDADPTAVMGRRIAAAVIDALLVLVPFFLYQTSQMETLSRPNDDVATEYCEEFNDAFADGICVSVGSDVYFQTEVDPAPSLALLGLSFGVYVVLQGLTGWTPGKLVTGIRTVRADGQAPGVGRALVRWLLWIVDALPVLWLVGLITSLTSTGHRRVGDMAAATYVVAAGAAGHPVAVPGHGLPASAAGVPAYAAPGTAAQPWSSGAPAPTAKPGPQWDDARGTYIQWDPEQREWVQWDEAARVWGPIQVAPAPPVVDDVPPPPPPPPPVAPPPQ